MLTKLILVVVAITFLLMLLWGIMLIIIILSRIVTPALTCVISPWNKCWCVGVPMMLLYSLV